MAYKEAGRRGHNYVGVDHLVWAIFNHDEGPAFDLLVSTISDFCSLRDKINQGLNSLYDAGDSLAQNKRKEEILAIISQLAEAIKNDL